MMRMEHRQTQSLKQTQQLVLTMKMQQALHILQLSTLELEQYVELELEANPFLEVTQKKEDLSTAVEAPVSREDEPAPDISFDLDDFADRWDMKRREGQDLSRNDDLYDRWQYYEDSITQQESLRAHLLSQMRIAAADELTYLIGERIIIGDINDKGYFTGDTALIAQELGVPVEKVDEVLSILQRFEPTGVAARNVVECLLLQIDAEHPKNQALRTLVKEHLEDLSHRQIPKIAKAMHIKPEDVEDLRKLLATLNPWPGYVYAAPSPQYVTPDVVVEKVEGEYIVRLTNERVPDLRVNSPYGADVRKQAANSDERDFIRQKLESATWIKRNIEQRQQTILKVAQAIVDVQSDFLEKGVEFIHPLTLQNIADRVGVHESTVARTTRGKYIQTPQGLFELKYFFSAGLTSDNGESQSSKSLQALVKKIIDEEDKRKPLSDQKIAEIIHQREGINIARRTVTKYREGMGILKTSMRKEY